MSKTVTYKPLYTAPPEESKRTALLDSDGYDDEDEEEKNYVDIGVKCRGEKDDSIYVTTPSRNTIQSSIHGNCCNGLFHQSWNLRHLRSLLYFAAIVLFLIFVIGLAGRDENLSNQVTESSEQAHSTSNSFRNSIGQRKRDRYSIEAAAGPLHQSYSLNSSTTVTNQQENLLTSRHRAKKPLYNSYIASVSNKRYDSHQNYLDDDLELSGGPLCPERHRQVTFNQRPAQQWWSVGTRNASQYITVTNYIRSMKSFNQNYSVTLTTQATIEFLHHTLELCKRWDGPISIAVFTPGSELHIATTMIKFMRLCLPDPLSACIRDKISWHFVYNNLHGPDSDELCFPQYYVDLDNYSEFAKHNKCPKFVGPEPSDLIKQLEVDMRIKNGLGESNYRKKFRLAYPINVLRNSAREASTTRFLMASDIELYPSTNLVSSFSNYISTHNITREYSQVNKFVFTLPIFEIELNTTVPKTKKELVNLFLKGSAIFFHKHVCDICQNFPGRYEWLKTDINGLKNFHTPEGQLSIFDLTRRNHSLNSWEPIFIGTREDPPYDDRLTWEGRRDKMGQMYEMCLQDYHLLILGNAFLVHSPGIKHIDKVDNLKRRQFILENNAIYDATMAKLRQKYAQFGSNKKQC